LCERERKRERERERKKEKQSERKETRETVKRERGRDPSQFCARCRSERKGEGWGLKERGRKNAIRMYIIYVYACDICIHMYTPLHVDIPYKCIPYKYKYTCAHTQLYINTYIYVYVLFHI